MKKKWILRLVLFGLASVLVMGCQPKTKLSSGEGYIDVTGGKVWYKIVGSGTETPLVLLHGGPGYPSYYLNPLAELSKNRPIIFLDQLGCGRSDRHADTTLMNIETFVTQVHQFVNELGLKKFYLYGHSWGGILGMEYYLKHPEQVKAMILASPALSIPQWLEDCNELIQTLPDSVQMAIKTSEESGNYDSREYNEAIGMFYRKFVAKKLPWDSNMDSTIAGANMDIYHYMWGPSEFTASGTLKNYDRINQLQSISIPSLYISGEFDEVLPSTLKHFQSLTPGAKSTIIGNAAHITMHDNPKPYLQAIDDFLKEIDNQ